MRTENWRLPSWKIKKEEVIRQSLQPWALVAVGVGVQTEQSSPRQGGGK